MSRHPRRRKPAAPTFPQVAKTFDAMSRGFAREGMFRHGVYPEGGQPTLYDPEWTGQRMPEATLRHEEIHQQLTLYTSHGILSLILRAYARAANASASMEACFHEQRVIQELGATYGELAFVQRRNPADFVGYIMELPSAAKGGDPYREAFDFANWLLPLDDAAQHERFDIRTLVIGALCSCSMNTACLREIAQSSFDDARFTSWLTDHSPSRRLKQIAMAAGPASFLTMTQVAATRLGQRRPTLPRLLELFDELSRVMLAHVPTLTAEPLPELRRQAHAAVKRLRKDCSAFVFDVEKALTPTGPLFTDPPEKRKLLERRFGFDDLATGN